MFDPHDYSIEVRRVEIEGERTFEATVREIPHVRGYGDEAIAAYQEVVDAIADLQEMMLEAGQPFPPPLGHTEAITKTGRVTVRLPPPLHEAVARAAVEQGVSINQFISTVIAFAAGNPGAYFARAYSGRAMIEEVARTMIVTGTGVSLTIKRDEPFEIAAPARPTVVYNEPAAVKH